MKKSFFLFLLFVNAFSLSAQDKYTISGYITDKSNGESIVGANIYCEELSVGVSSNTYGFYSLTLHLIIMISYLVLLDIKYKNNQLH